MKYSAIVVADIAWVRMIASPLAEAAQSIITTAIWKKATSGLVALRTIVVSEVQRLG
jgi:hypothetical protein